MLEGEFPRVKKDSAKFFRLFPGRAVQSVSDQWMPYMTQVNPYLMRSPCEYMTLDKSVSAAAPQDPELCNSRFSVGIDGHTQPVA